MNDNSERNLQCEKLQSANVFLLLLTAVALSD